MAVKPTWNPSNNRLKEQLAARMIQTIINWLILVGEKIVAEARTGAGYKDITGNLKASIGYVVLHNGLIVHTGGFETEHNGSDKATGAREGRALLDGLIMQHSQGFVLIAVAGMNYAAHVESMGKDVLTGAGIIAKNMLQEIFNK